MVTTGPESTIIWLNKFHDLSHWLKTCEKIPDSYNLTLAIELKIFLKLSCEWKQPDLLLTVPLTLLFRGLHQKLRYFHSPISRPNFDHIFQNFHEFRPHFLSQGQGNQGHQGGSWMTQKDDQGTALSNARAWIFLKFNWTVKIYFVKPGTSGSHPSLT